MSLTAGEMSPGEWFALREPKAGGLVDRRDVLQMLDGREVWAKDELVRVRWFRNGELECGGLSM